MDTKDRLRKCREDLSLTQDYVAKYLGVPRTAVVQMESGNRKVSGDELIKLSCLFGVSVDYILGTQQQSDAATMFARSFDNLPEEDKQEIINLIEFKKRLALHR